MNAIDISWGPRCPDKRREPGHILGAAGAVWAPAAKVHRTSAARLRYSSLHICHRNSWARFPQPDQESLASLVSLGARWLGHHSCGSRCRPAMKSRPERAGPFSAKQASGISEPNPPTLPKHPNATVTVILIAGWSIEREHEIKRQPRRYPDGLQHNRRRSTAARKPLTSTWAARYNKRRKPIMRAEELPPGDRPNANVDD